MCSRTWKKWRSLSLFRGFNSYAGSLPSSSAEWFAMIAYRPTILLKLCSFIGLNYLCSALGCAHILRKASAEFHRQTIEIERWKQMSLTWKSIGEWTQVLCTAQVGLWLRMRGHEGLLKKVIISGVNMVLQQRWAVGALQEKAQLSLVYLITCDSYIPQLWVFCGCQEWGKQYRKLLATGQHFDKPPSPSPAPSNASNTSSVQTRKLCQPLHSFVYQINVAYSCPPHLTYRNSGWLETYFRFFWNNFLWFATEFMVTQPKSGISRSDYFQKI